jgi:hypothetical protein
VSDGDSMAVSEHCDSCGSEGPTRFSAEHAARFCAECWARENAQGNAAAGQGSAQAATTQEDT